MDFPSSANPAFKSLHPRVRRIVEDDDEPAAPPPTKQSKPDTARGQGGALRYNSTDIEQATFRHRTQESLQQASYASVVAASSQPFYAHTSGRAAPVLVDLKQQRKENRNAAAISDLDKSLIAGLAAIQKQSSSSPSSSVQQRAANQQPSYHFGINLPANQQRR